MSIGRQAARAAAWNYAAFVTSKGLLFVATLILARLLSPDDFGLVGMALLVILVLDVLRDFGVGSALIYRQDDVEGSANVAFLLSVLIGASLFVANWLIAPFAVAFFEIESSQKAEELVSLLRVLGLSLLFASLGSTHDAMLQKGINYRLRMWPEVGRTMVKGLLSVGLALSGFGVWSLVIGQVVGEAAATVLLWIVSPWRPRRRLPGKHLRPMLGYGSQIMAVNGLGTLLVDVDYLVIGRILGETALGLYTLAFRIPELAVKNLAIAVSAVAFPVATRLQTDMEAMREAYLRMQQYMLLILAPLGFGMAAATPSLVILLLGEKWAGTIPAMTILSVYIVLAAVSHWPGVIYKAVGRPAVLTTVSAVKLVVLVPALIAGALWGGIEGVAWAQLLMAAVGIGIDLLFVSRVAGVDPLHNLRVIAPSILAAAGMALLMRGIFALDDDAASLPTLIIASLAGAAAYAGLIWLLDREAVRGLLRLALGALGREDPSSPAPASHPGG
jgi:O-antigen/teichoic acid export membrane protein